MAKWFRIPANVSEEQDRRTMAAILTAYGLEVRIVRIRDTNRGSPKRYMEYRDTGLATPKLLQKQDAE